MPSLQSTVQRSNSIKLLLQKYSFDIDTTQRLQYYSAKVLDIKSDE